MGSCACLHINTRDLNHTYFSIIGCASLIQGIAILSICIFPAMESRRHGMILNNQLINCRLQIVNHVPCEPSVMSDVQSSSIHIFGSSCLPDMRSQDFTSCGADQMLSCMMATQARTAFIIDCARDLGSDRRSFPFQTVNNYITYLLDLDHLTLFTTPGNYARIAQLASSFWVKQSVLQGYLTNIREHNL